MAAGYVRGKAELVVELFDYYRQNLAHRKQEYLDCSLGRPASEALEPSFSFDVQGYGQASSYVELHEVSTLSSLVQNQLQSAYLQGLASPPC